MTQCQPYSLPSPLLAVAPCARSSAAHGDHGVGGEGEYIEAELSAAGTTIHIREYRPDDYPALAAMWGASGQRPFSAQSIEKLMDGAGNALVAEAESGEVVACAFWSHNGDMAFLWRLVVKETYRGQGIARMLVHAVEEEIQQAGFEALGLMVRVPNEPAKCLYRSEGYEHMSNTEYWRKGL